MQGDLLGELLLRLERGKSAGGSKPGEAKNEAGFPGRVPHVRPSVHGPGKTGRSPFRRYWLAAKSKNRGACGESI
jgi:hypothetical protein